MLDNNLIGTNMIVVDTFDYNSHVFGLVLDENKYYLKLEQNSNLIKKLIIKPDIWVFFKDGGYEQGVNLLKPINPLMNKVLAMDFNIDPDIFELLINNKLISYSKAMADLYGFDPKFSSDYFYHSRDYKRSKNKQLVLEKFKRGQFN